MPNCRSEKPGRRKLVLRVAAWSVMCVLSLVLVAGSVVYLLVFHKIPPPAVAVKDPASGFLLQAQIERSKGSLPSDPPKIIRIDEASINGFLRQQLAANNKGPSVSKDGRIREARVQLKGDRMHVYLAFVVRGRDMTFDVQGKLRSRNGLIEFSPDSGRIGALPIPRSFLQTALQRMTDSPEGLKQKHLPPGTKSLYVENDMMVIIRE